MSLKSISLNAAVAGVLAIGGAVAMPAFTAPAHALSLAPGGFVVNGTGITGQRINNNTFTVKFDTGTFTLSGQQGELTDLAGTPILKNLTLNRVSSTSTFTSVATSEFIRGLTLAGRSVFFDLDAATFTGSFTGNNVFNFAGTTESPLTGTLRAVGINNTNETIGTATVSTLKVSQSLQGTANVQVQTVPTPALLPGVIGFGVAALRKRKGEASTEAEPETVEVKA
ncbi:PTPA-CTERM sorting domain-containing protein [Leptolyngbya sp. AN03gr2]|uniref:PTPA-CTERM sorting domain-containing protein n=1 Tax=unclassified Leptolyngbya TaxID=2650499 RepID=UPI003D31E256